MTDIGIGRLAALTGVKVPTIRFYEQTGLVSPPHRTEGGQRRYDESAVHRLQFIRHARQLGFDLSDVRQLLALSQHPDASSNSVREIARHHLQQIETKIARLRLIQSELKRVVDACDGGPIAGCPILEAIGHEAPLPTEQSASAVCPSGQLASAT
jgi:Cu(I)-responsive transcriptional regulator